MTDQIDQEIGAIKELLRAFEPLSPEARRSVLEYVLKRLEIALDPPQPVAPSGTSVVATGFAPGAAQVEVAPPAHDAASLHIKDLKNKKSPRSANEMAALVAYYLEHETPLDQQKDRVSTKDIDTYFKIAGFRIPAKARFTLSNAKAAGYLDAVGNGKYKLNAVGYNLVVHSMPRGATGSAPPKRKPPKKKTSKKGKTARKKKK